MTGHHHHHRRPGLDEATRARIEAFGQVIDAWYARTPSAAATDAFHMPLELFRHGEQEMALDELPIRMRMHDVRLTREEHTFLVGVVRSFEGPVDQELLDEFDEQLDLWADEPRPS